MHSPLRHVVALLAVAVVVIGVVAASAATRAPSVAHIAPWKLRAAPVAWAAGRIYYNRKSTSGLFDGWSARPDGSGARCLTCGRRYPRGTQHGISDVTPDGAYALVTVERAEHPPLPRGSYLAAPGNGAFNDLWLQSLHGSHAWRLVDLRATHTNALIWARFDASARRVVWSEQWKWGLPFGGWRLHVAKLSWSHGVPSLTQEQTLQSAGFVEPYGFTADGSHILVAADALAGTPWNDLQVMSVPASLRGAPRRLSPRDAGDRGSFTNYNEFAYVMPGSGRIIFARSVGAWYSSLEYWTMNANGSDARQLTWLSRPTSSQYHGHPSLAGGLAFDPADPRRFVAGIETDLSGDYKSLMITLG
jgi:hypothetical protein